MITAAVLSPSLDISYEVDGFTVGEIHRPALVQRCAGGKGLNMARAARRLGASVQTVPVLGGAVGELLASLLTEEGIPATAVANAQETRICVSVAGARSSDGVMTEVYQRATPLADGVLAEVAAVLERVLTPPTGWLALSGGLPAGTAPEEVAEMLSRARRRGVAVAVDCYGELLPRLLQVGVDLVKVNRVEAAGLLGAGACEVGLVELTSGLAAAAGCPVVVTDGAAGSVLHQDGRTWVVAASERRGQHPVGSGDSYLGGLLAGLEEGRTLLEAVRLGAGAATANALLPGPGRLEPGLAREIAAELEFHPG